MFLSSECQKPAIVNPMPREIRMHMRAVAGALVVTLASAGGAAPATAQQATTATQISADIQHVMSGQEAQFQAALINTNPGHPHCRRHLHPSKRIPDRHDWRSLPFSSHGLPSAQLVPPGAAGTCHCAQRCAHRFFA
jgi:hypothetical protein